MSQYYTKNPPRLQARRRKPAPSCSARRHKHRRERLRPAISGKFPTIDAPFDKERNRLYVAATPPDEIRNALAGDSPTKSGASAVLPEVSNVSWNKQKMTIKSGEPFEIVGAQLTLVVGDEKAELIPPHGNPVAVDLDPIEDGAWQRISGRLKQPMDACEGATLKLWTHGLDSTSQLFELKKSSITVLAGEEPVPTNPPHIDRAWPTGNPEEFDLIRAGDSFTVSGENLQGASWKISHADDGETWIDEQSIPADKVTFVGGNAVIDEQWLDVYFNNCNLGEQILIAVENAAGSDFVRRELASV